MKDIVFEAINGLEIVKLIYDPTIDTEGTADAVERYRQEYPEEARNKTDNDLFYENAVYLMVGPNQKRVTDEEGNTLKEQFEALDEKHVLTIGGDVYPNFTGVEYWIRKSGVWEKKKIEEMFVDLPAGAVLDDNLTIEQRREIDDQREKKRIAELSEEDLEKEIQSALDAAADETDRIKRRKTIQGEAFDETAYYQEKKAEIMGKYHSTGNYIQCEQTSMT